MVERKQALINNVEKHKEEILETERWLWEHPQTGFTEWDAHNYLADKFQKLGYELILAGNIPGFYTDVCTGKPGPTVCVIGELDALDIPNHPESVNGMAHLCGHHAQGAALLGVAKALKEENALDNLCGKIRLMMVPAEELTQLEYRNELREKGIIKYFGGKTEFMSRGYFDSVDMAMMVHQGGKKGVFDACYGCIGCMTKSFTFKGKTAHAGADPHKGVNAQYAALLALQACNNLRETFIDNENIRFHPVIKSNDCAVNNIPDEVKAESYVRGRTIEAIKRENKKINRALAGAALAMGAKVKIQDRSGYAPMLLDKNFLKLTEQCCIELAGEENVRFGFESIGKGSTDFGDLSCIMPCSLFNVSNGYSGCAHQLDYKIVNPYRLCVDSAKAQVLVLDALLTNNAAEANRIIENFTPRYPSIKDYLNSISDINSDIEAVVYDEEGNARVDF